MLHVRNGDVKTLVLNLSRGADIAEQPVDVDVQLEDIRGFFGQLEIGWLHLDVTVVVSKLNTDR